MLELHCIENILLVLYAMLTFVFDSLHLIYRWFW